MRYRTLKIFAIVSTVAVPSAHAACDLNATPANFASQLSAAQPGQTLCLATGDYGAFNGVAKTSPGVTITAVSGATPTMNLQFRQPSPFPAWLIFDGITISGGELSGPAHDLTFKNSTFTDKLNIWQDGNNNACSNCPAMNNNNIVFDNDLFNMAANPSGAGGYEGRINLLGGSTPAGVTIKNSKFTNGCADGIQVDSGGIGVTIGPNNEFYNILQGNCGPHVDGIQFVGSTSPGPTITGNYFHDNSDGIIAFDYGNSAFINNNVIVNVAQDPICAGGMDSASVIEHNTIIGNDIICGFTHEANSCTAVIRNNITDGFDGGGTTINGTTGSNPSYFDYNLCTQGSCAFASLGAGAHSLTGQPTYVGGSSPTTYAGYALVSTSLGVAKASDGTNMGINVSGSPPPPPPSAGACDLNSDNAVNSADVQSAVNQTLGVAPCTTANLQQTNPVTCTAIDVQRVVNAVLGGSCVTGP